MISLEQIRLLEDKITRAIDLIRILKEENTTLRKGLDSAQRRMKELEGLVDGFKNDQQEIESAILRTLKNLDELEETTAAGRTGHASRKAAPSVSDGGEASPAEDQSVGSPAGKAGEQAAQGSAGEGRASDGRHESAGANGRESGSSSRPLNGVNADQSSQKGELDIF